MATIRPTLFSLSVFLCLFIVIEGQLSSYATLDTKVSKKPYKKTQKKGYARDKPHLHKDTADFVKKLEYDSNVKEGANALDFGLHPIDLNLLRDEEIAADVEEGVQEEFAAIDQEFGETENAPKRDKKPAITGPISLMHQGMYTPSLEHNALIDGLIDNVKRDLRKRNMDPLYFAIHSRGVVRHSPSKKFPLQDGLFGSPAKLRDEVVKENQTSVKPLGVGIITGLLKLKRFGNAESREDGNVTLVRSHYFFGPLNIDMIFGTVQGVIILNASLPSLAAHCLIEISNVDNSNTLKEFITDSPMEYEIRLRGSKNPRFRSLTQESLMRLFKRGRRMETRLERSFKRGLQKPIRDITSKRRKNKENGRARRKKEKVEIRKQ